MYIHGFGLSAFTSPGIFHKAHIFIGFDSHLVLKITGTIILTFFLKLKSEFPNIRIFYDPCINCQLILRILTHF